MSFITSEITPVGSNKKTDVTKDLIDIGSFNLYSDESDFFGGVFRRSSIDFELNNNKRIYSTRDNPDSFFQNGREGSIVDFSWNSNDIRLKPFFLFRGIITEDSTQNDLTSRNIRFTSVDQLKLIDQLTLSESDMRSLTKNLNRDFIIDFLKLVFAKKTDNLNNIFNVFKEDGTTENISLSLESIFPPSDSFYNSINTSAVDLLNRLLSSTNSYSVLENSRDNSVFFIRSRPSLDQNIKLLIDIKDIISIENQTDGYAKIYNKIIINSFTTYVKEDSILKFGERILDIQSLAPPSQTLADSYFDYYAFPRQELDLSLKFNHKNLDLNIGDRIHLSVSDLNSNFTIHPINNSNFFIIRKELDFDYDIIKLRLRELPFIE